MGLEELVEQDEVLVHERRRVLGVRVERLAVLLQLRMPRHGGVEDGERVVLVEVLRGTLREDPVAEPAAGEDLGIAAPAPRVLDHIERPRQSPAGGQVLALEAFEGAPPAPGADRVDHRSVILEAGDHLGERCEDVGGLDRGLGLWRDAGLEERSDELGRGAGGEMSRLDQGGHVVQPDDVQRWRLHSSLPVERAGPRRQECPVVREDRPAVDELPQLAPGLCHGWRTLEGARVDPEASDDPARGAGVIGEGSAERLERLPVPGGAPADRRHAEDSVQPRVRTARPEHDTGRSSHVHPRRARSIPGGYASLAIGQRRRLGVVRGGWGRFGAGRRFNLPRGHFREIGGVA